jgi:hypothetical protein
LPLQLLKIKIMNKIYNLKFYKTLFLLFITSFLSFSSIAQVIIGTGTSVLRFPFSFYFGFTSDASIYTSSEMNTVSVGGTITTISWYSSIASSTTGPTEIYLKQVGSTAVLAAADWATTITGATSVYSGTPANWVVGWNSIDITDYAIPAGQNLAILVESNFGGGGTGGTTSTQFQYSTKTNSHAVSQADGAAPTGNLTINNNRPNITLGGLNPPSCLPPTAVTISGITTTTATANFTAPAGSYIVEYGLVGFTPGLGATAGAGGTIVTGASSPVALSSLSPSSTYQLYIRSNCGAGVFSANSAVLNFSTTCAISDIPYVMPIESVTAPAIPLCTSIENIGSLANTWVTTSSTSVSGYTYPALAYFYNSSNPANDWIYTNALNLVAGTSYTLKYKYSNDLGSTYPEAMKVAIGSANNVASMTTVLADYPSIVVTVPAFANNVFTVPLTGVYYIGFHAYSDADQDVLLLDEVSVIVTPSCLEPLSLTPGVVNTSSVTVNWPVVSGALSYEYVLDALTTDPIVAGTNITTNTVTLPGTYTLGTTYYMHVRTVCTGSTFSTWKTTPVIIPPLCTTNLLPANMATGITNPVNLTWTASVGATSYNVFLSNDNGVTYASVGNIAGTSASLNLVSSGTFYWYVQPSNGGVASGCVSSATSFTTIPAPVNDAPCGALNLVIDDVSPLCTNTVGALVNAGEPDNSASCSTPNNTVWYKFTPTVNGIHSITASIPAASTNGMAAWLYTYTATGTCPSTLTFTAAGGITCGGAPTSGVAGTTTTLFTSSLTAGTTYYIYVDGQSGDNGDICLKVASPALCPAPTALSVSAITTNSSSITWVGTGTNILEYGLTGFTPGTGATAGVGGTIISSATSPQALTGLISGATYQVYVRQDCSVASNGYSLNSNVAAFTTIPPIPLNDEATGAIALTVGATCTGAIYNNTSATQSATEPFPSCKGTAGFGGMWYKFIAPASGSAKISCDENTGTFGDSRMALYSSTNPSDYTTFNILSCDDDNGVIVGARSLFYYSGLTAGATYYVLVDLYSSFSTRGTYCVTVDELSSSMLSSTTATCQSGSSLSSYNASYTGWVSLVDATTGNLDVNVRQTAGTATDFSASRTITSGASRLDALGQAYLNRNFLINATGATAADVQLFFLNSEVTSLGGTIAGYNVTRVAGSTCSPNLATGAKSLLLQTANGTANAVSYIQVSTPGFSNFFIHNSTIVLPLSIEFFKGSKLTAGNFLDWKVTCTSAPSVELTLERSADGRDFKAINTQNESASRCLQGFNYIDASPLADANYYRLKMTTPDGAFRYSAIVVILNKSKGFELISIAPNPVKERAILTLTSAKAGKMEITISDVAGKVISKQSIVVIAGNNPINLNVATLGAGTYSITAVNAEAEIKTTRFVKY